MYFFNHIHPFPARMASDIAFEHVRNLARESVVADPMCGSGTVLRVSAEDGHRSVGFDLDPLAVLISRVWTTPVDLQAVLDAATTLVADAKSLGGGPVPLPWADSCPETRDFIDRWFEPQQQIPLRSLSFLLAPRVGPIADVLRVALSRMIITKEKGASVARDTSHSRPHRWFVSNDYDVWKGYGAAVARVLARLKPERLDAPVVANMGDARNLRDIPDEFVDAVITSPPYVNAIDYIRGHRLALVWLGYDVRHLRFLRSSSIGTEQAAKSRPTAILSGWLDAVTGGRNALPRRQCGILQRYAEDIVTMLQEQMRILRKGGKLTLVVGNSQIRSVFVENSEIIRFAARAIGLVQLQEARRDLHAASRYLPISAGQHRSPLDLRMREEVVLTFLKA